MDSFDMNGYRWQIKYVDQNDEMLVDRLNILTVGTTDTNSLTVYLSDRLHGDFKLRVLLHELGHCALYSYSLLDDIHRMVYPEHWVEAEEFICNIIANYGLEIFRIAYPILGEDGWRLIPGELNNTLKKGA